MSLLHLTAAVLVSILWGGNFVAAKIGVSHFPPFFLTFLRFSVVALLLLPFVKSPPRDKIPSIILLSTVLGTLHFSLLFAGLYFGLAIPGSAILGQMGVPFACLLGAFFFGDRLGMFRISGMVLAFFGMGLVTGAPNIAAHPFGLAATLGGAFFWAVGNILIKRIQGVGHFQLLAWMAVFAAPQLLLLSTLFESGQWAQLAAAPPSVMLAVAYTAIGSTIAAYGMWYALLSRYQVSQVTPFSLLAPVFGIAVGQLFFAEEITWQVMVGGLVVMTGVGIIVLRRPEMVRTGEG